LANEIAYQDSLVSPEEHSIDAERFFTDLEGNPLPEEDGFDTVQAVMDKDGEVKTIKPGGILAWIEIANTGPDPIDSITTQDTLPQGWEVHPPGNPAKSGVHVYFNVVDDEHRIIW